MLIHYWIKNRYQICNQIHSLKLCIQLILNLILYYMKVYYKGYPIDIKGFWHPGTPSNL